MQEKERALRLVAVLRNELADITEETRRLVFVAPMSSFYTLPLEELKRWKVRAVDEISTQISRFEGDNLRIKTARPSTSILQEVNSGQRFVDEADAYDRFLRELEIAIEINPGRVLSTSNLKTLTNAFLPKELTS